MAISPIKADMTVRSTTTVDRRKSMDPAHPWCTMTDPGGWLRRLNTIIISTLTNPNIILKSSITMLDHQWLLRVSSSTEHRLQSRDLPPTGLHGLDKLRVIRKIGRGKHIIPSHRQEGVIG
jgi:hypothetical protein